MAITAISGSTAFGQVAWTDWTSTGANTVFGSFVLGATTVTVTYSGSYSFAQTGCGTDYWTPNVYTGPGVPNAPPACDIVALDAGGQKTITFSQAVVDPLFSLVSWNGQGPIGFNGPLQVVSSGCGFWGCGTVGASGNTLLTSGEAHGTIRLLGTYTQITFTDGSENWHGFTVGATDLPTVVPEPSSFVLLASGLVGVFGIVRRRRNT